jgi:hypothetical protein
MVEPKRKHYLNYEWLAMFYVVFSVGGFSLFLAFGYTHTTSGDKLRSLSHLITATETIEALFAVFLALHGLVAMLYYALLIKYCDRVPNWAGYLVSVCIFVFTLLTGVYATQPYDNAHFAFATLAFAFTAIAGAVVVFSCPSSADWKRYVVYGCILVSTCLLIPFAILANVGTANNEGPLEWTSIYLLSVMGYLLYYIVRDECKSQETSRVYECTSQEISRVDEWRRSVPQVVLFDPKFTEQVEDTDLYNNLTGLLDKEGVDEGKRAAATDILNKWVIEPNIWESDMKVMAPTNRRLRNGDGTLKTWFEFIRPHIELRYKRLIEERRVMTDDGEFEPLPEPAELLLFPRLQL